MREGIRVVGTRAISHTNGTLLDLRDMIGNNGFCVQSRVNNMVFQKTGQRIGQNLFPRIGKIQKTKA